MEFLVSLGAILFFIILVGGGMLFLAHQEAKNNKLIG